MKTEEENNGAIKDATAKMDKDINIYTGKEDSLTDSQIKDLPTSMLNLIIDIIEKKFNT